MEHIGEIARRVVFDMQSRCGTITAGEEVQGDEKQHRRMAAVVRGVVCNGDVLGLPVGILAGGTEERSTMTAHDDWLLQQAQDHYTNPCHECGFRIDDGEDYCPQCGCEVEEETE